MDKEALQEILNEMSVSVGETYSVKAGKLYWVMPLEFKHINDVVKSKKYRGYHIRQYKPTRKSDKIPEPFHLVLVTENASKFITTISGPPIQRNLIEIIPITTPVLVLNTFVDSTLDYIDMIVEDKLYKKVVYSPLNSQTGWCLIPAKPSDLDDI